MEIFNKICREKNIAHNAEELFKYMYAYEEKNKDGQLELFP
jgi:hypothetical protein